MKKKKKKKKKKISVFYDFFQFLEVAFFFIFEWACFRNGWFCSDIFGTLYALYIRTAMLQEIPYSI